MFNGKNWLNKRAKKKKTNFEVRKNQKLTWPVNCIVK